jgi:Arc/MetJ family transcription regulator
MCLWYGTGAIPSENMKMTMHIDEDVLRDVMALTGAPTKTEAVELALRELARQYRQKQFLKEGLQLTPDQWDRISKPMPSDDLDAPDIDQAAVQRFLYATDPGRVRERFPLGYVAEEQAVYDPKHSAAKGKGA